MSASKQKVIEEEVKDMLSKGVILLSSSPWASPVALVNIKDGSICFCIDYHCFYKIAYWDVYPMPCIDDALDSLQGTAYFSSFDLRSGYWQIPMEPSDIEKTTLTTTEGLHELRVMPFGMSNVPSSLERLMDTVLPGLQ